MNVSGRTIEQLRELADAWEESAQLRTDMAMSAMDDADARKDEIVAEVYGLCAFELRGILDTLTDGGA